MEHTHCLLWAMICPAVMGYAVLKQLLSFGWPQVGNLKKSGSLREKEFS